jgi:hypothetical protein
MALPVQFVINLCTQKFYFRDSIHEYNTGNIMSKCSLVPLRLTILINNVCVINVEMHHLN